MMDAYFTLANAIIVQAAQDYRFVLQLCKSNPNEKEYHEELKDLEEFFQSGWFSTLTSLDGVELLNKLRGENCRKAVAV